MRVSDRVCDLDNRHELDFLSESQAEAVPELE
jgi:hypothetical protein